MIGWKVESRTGEGLNVLGRQQCLVTPQKLAILWYVDVTIYIRCKLSSHAIASLETRVR